MGLSIDLCGTHDSGEPKQMHYPDKQENDMKLVTESSLPSDQLCFSSEENECDTNGNSNEERGLMEYGYVGVVVFCYYYCHCYFHFISLFSIRPCFCGCSLSITQCSIPSPG